jgi:hypothetical protein
MLIIFNLNKNAKILKLNKPDIFILKNIFPGIFPGHYTIIVLSKNEEQSNEELNKPPRPDN